MTDISKDGPIASITLNWQHRATAEAIAHTWTRGDKDPIDAIYEALVDAEKSAMDQLHALRQRHLVQARLIAGLNLRPTAELLDISPRELGDRENGRSNPDAAEWDRMFRQLAMAANTGAA